MWWRLCRLHAKASVPKWQHKHRPKDFPAFHSLLLPLLPRAHGCIFFPISLSLPFSLFLSSCFFWFCFSSRKSKRGKGKGQKRKRKRGRYKPQIFHCEPCSEKRKHLFVQDAQTCKCSCKYTDARCKLRQLELNERTCRCEKPRRWAAEKKGWGNSLGCGAWFLAWTKNTNPNEH